MRISDWSSDVCSSELADRTEPMLRVEHAAGDEIAVAAGIFGQAVEHDVGAVLERRGTQRAEEGVVDGDRRAGYLGEGGVDRGAPRLQVDERVGGGRRAYEIDHRDLHAQLQYGKE